MLIEGDRIVVLRLDNERKGLRIALEDAERGIGEQGAAEALATKALIDRKTTDEGDRQNRIAREPFQNFRRQIVGRNTRRREGVITGNRIRRRLDDEKTTRHEPLHILRGLFAEITIKGLGAAAEGRTIMSAERLNDKAARHRNSLINSR